MNEDQVNHHIRDIEDIHGDAGGQDADAPLVPFETSLRYTRAQEIRLVDQAMKRLKELEDELGRNKDDGLMAAMDYGNSLSEAIGELVPEEQAAARRRFLTKRFLYRMIYENRLDWRPFMMGGIFIESNLTVPLVRRVVRQMIARGINYFFGTAPWCAASPVGVEDVALADQIQKYGTYKMDESGTQGTLERALENAFVMGEQAVKTTYVRDFDYYTTILSVLVDAQGRDILGEDQDYITEQDTFVPVDGAQINPAGGPLPMVLQRDGVTPQPIPMFWVTKEIERKITYFEGAKSKNIYVRDFLCPLTAESVQTADMIAHLYQAPVMDLVDKYRRQEKDETAEKGIEESQKMIDAIRLMGSSSSEAKSELARPRAELAEDYSETSSGVAAGEPVIEIAECWMRFDANGDGRMENILLVLDRTNERPLFYDYVGNVTPDGLRPIEIVRVNPVDGRWYGLGAIEMFESSQAIVDLLVNRQNVAQGSSGRLDIFDPAGFVEGQVRASMGLNYGHSYQVKPGVNPKEVFHSEYLKNMKDAEFKTMMEFFIQIVMNESGVQHANDAQMAGLDSAKLATGVRNIEKSGQELFAIYISHLQGNLEKVVKREMMLTFAHLDEKEAFHFFEGDVSRIATLTAATVRSLDLDVRILLTRYKGEQTMQMCAQAISLINEFYAKPLPLQTLVAPFFRDMMKALQVPEAEKVLIPGIYYIPMTTGPTPPPSAPPQSGLASPPNL